MTDNKPYATAGASAPSANKRCGRNRIIWHALPVFVLALWVMFLLLSSPTSHDDSPPSPHLYTILVPPDTAPIDSHLVLPTQRPEPILPSPPQTPVLPPQPPRRPKETDAAAEAHACAGRYIYVHNLPPKFNAGLLRDCRSLSNWTNMCLFISNGGLGPRLQGYPGGRGSSWYATNQFALDVIFHERMKNQYPCLTRDSSLASAVFVPFYAGLEVARNLWVGRNSSALDAAALELMQWLRARPEWERMGGRDHFFVAGRITWDFRRLNDDNPAWGSRLLLMPEGRNMTALVLESSPWDSNDVAIPYPTYFHPKSESEVEQWQIRLRGLNRPWLFSFAGGGRPGMKSSIRGQIIQQCQASKRCRLLDCSSNKQSSSCHSPGNVMRLFERSVFCLQPQGDSYTRRSAFDAMVAGCIPVFFHPGSAYVQYQWHLPAQGYGNYSVFIPEDEVRQRNSSLKIEQVLANIGEEKAAVMRENVIGLIPRLVYADPRVQWGSGGSIKDAFDAAVDGMLKRVATIRSEVTGTASGNSDANTKFEEHNSWKAALGAANQGPHEWDRFFS